MRLAVLRAAGLLCLVAAALVHSSARAAPASEPGAGARATAPARSASGEAPARGKFLIASRQLVEPTFARRVVLLLDHDARQGGIGLVINRPTGVSLTRVVRGLEGLVDRGERIRSGGPVERNRVFMLMRAEHRPPGTEQILADTFGSSTLDPLRALVASGEVESVRFVVYAGYSGWAPGQLEAEIERGDWHVAPGRSEHLFDIDPAEVWPRLIRFHGGRWVERPRFAATLAPAVPRSPSAGEGEGRHLPTSGGSGSGRPRHGATAAPG